MNINDVRNFDSPTMYLGGKQRTIQFDLNAFAEMENRYGSVTEAMNQLQTGRVSEVRSILWLGLIHEETNYDEVTGEPAGYNITPFQVGSWVKNMALLHEASEKIGLAMAADMPAPANVPDQANTIAAQANTADILAKSGEVVATVTLTPEEKAVEAKNV